MPYALRKEKERWPAVSRDPKLACRTMREYRTRRRAMVERYTQLQQLWQNAPPPAALVPLAAPPATPPVLEEEAGRGVEGRAYTLGGEEGALLARVQAILGKEVGAVDRCPITVRRGRLGEGLTLAHHQSRVDGLFECFLATSKPGPQERQLLVHLLRHLAVVSLLLHLLREGSTAHIPLPKSCPSITHFLRGLLRPGTPIEEGCVERLGLHVLGVSLGLRVVLLVEERPGGEDGGEYGRLESSHVLLVVQSSRKRLVPVRVGQGGGGWRVDGGEVVDRTVDILNELFDEIQVRKGELEGRGMGTFCEVKELYETVAEEMERQ